MLMVVPYVLLLLVGGVVPTAYAVVKSLQNESETGFGGLRSYTRVAGDFRFVETFQNVALTLIWLPIMLAVVVVLALLIDASPGRFGASMRFLYYLPGALAGIANFMLWLYLLNPGQSPIDFLWHGFGYTTLSEVAQPRNLPFILAAMLFFQGAGTWVVVVNGGLNGIPQELLEAAKLYGATVWGVAWRVKLPMIRPWLGYLTMLNLAYGFQLFLEPQVLSQAGHPRDDLTTVDTEPTQLHLRVPDPRHTGRCGVVGDAADHHPGPRPDGGLSHPALRRRTGTLCAPRPRRELARPAEL